MGVSFPHRAPAVRALAVLSVVLHLVTCSTAAPAAPAHFYPFGAYVNGSQALRTDLDDASSEEILLRVPINFYDTLYPSIFVNSNGLLSFLRPIPQFLNLQFPLDYPVIAPFYSNVDTRGTGTVYYHETEDFTALQTAAERVRRSFAAPSFQPTSVFVATWDHVGYHEMGTDKVNTFQVAISSDGAQSFVELMYAEDGIQWVQGKTANQGLPDARAQVGFMSGDGRSFLVRGSGTEHIGNIGKWSNANIPGTFLYQVGPTVNGQIVQADLAEDPSQEPASCFLDETICHPKAKCSESGDAACCVCQKGTYGNGRFCLTNDVPVRVNGKVIGQVNDVNLTGLDLQSYVMVQDGRPYTALSGVPQELGADLQLLSPIAMSLGFLFAKPAAPEVPNGFQLTGGTLTHRIEQVFPLSGERLTLVLRYQGMDVFDQLRLDVEVQGTVPSIPPSARIRLLDFDEILTRVQPGQLHATAQQAFTLDDSELQTQYTVDHFIEYSECAEPNWAPEESAAGEGSGALGGEGSVPQQLQELKLKTSVSLLSYEQREGIVRFAPNSKITNRLNEVDPCEQGRQRCGPNSMCVASGDTYVCHCSPGYHALYAPEDGMEECVDVNECQMGIAGCSSNATCFNLKGSFRCECHPGFVGDGRSCDSVSAVTADSRQPGADSVVQPGGPGYDVTPPAQNLGSSCDNVNCGPNAYCEDGACNCHPGFQYDVYRGCVPFAHAETSPLEGSAPGSACSSSEQCSPFGACVIDERTGLHSCVCLPGYYGDGQFCEPQGLEPSCDSSGECVCHEGYQFHDGVCIPLTIPNDLPQSCDALNNCHPHAQCLFLPVLQIHKCVCNAGYSGDGLECSNNAGSCLDLNDCHRLADCVPLEYEERYECQCKRGYRGDGRLMCEKEVPEGCEVTRDCHPDANCMPVGERYQCVCRAGYQGDGRHCERIAPVGCEVRRDCGRNAECIRTHGEAMHKCQCLPGYFGDGYRCDPERVPERPVERLTCGATGDRPCTEKETDYMVVAQGMALIRVPLLPPKTHAQAGRPIQFRYYQEAIGIDVDCVQQRIYWSDVASKSIRSAFYNGTNETAFLDEDIRSPEGVAVDWVSRNIYWADSEKDTIEVASLDNKGRRTIVRDGLVNPRGVAVHPQKGKLFWSDWDRNGPKLEWSNLDGSEREVFLQGSAVKLPNSLAIDFDQEELCWADAGTKKIECIGIDTGVRRIVVSNCTYPFGLALSADNYFWTDWQSHKVESASRPHGAAKPSKDVPLGGSGKMYSLVVIPQECRGLTNDCGWQRGYCNPDQICLLAGNRQRRCVCPENQACAEE